MRSTCQRRSSRAFTIFEMMVVLGLLGIVGLMAAQLFGATLKTSQGSAQAENTIYHFDSALRLLRSDVWNAEKAESPDSRTLLLHQPQGRTVTWRLDSEGTLVRQGGAGDQPLTPQRWPEFGVGLAFRVQAPRVVMQVADTKAQKGGQIVLISQLQLAKGGAE